MQNASKTKRNQAMSYPMTIMIVGFILSTMVLYRHQIAYIFHPRNDTKIINTLYDDLSDDAFYYFKIADKLSTISLSSFDGLHTTNGYQPLWMIILLGLGKSLPINSINFIAILDVTLIGLSAIGSFLFYRLSGRLFPKFSPIGSVCYFFSTLFLSKSGMEVSLLFVFIPLFLLLFLRALSVPTSINYFWLGIGASLLLLSRLDIVLFLLTLVLCSLLLSPRKLISTIGLTWKKLFSVLGGLIPFLAYLLFNFFNYGNFMPISGRAKMLQLGTQRISSTGLLSIVNAISHDKVITLFTLAYLLALPLMVLYIKKQSNLVKQAVVQSIILYPVVFFAYYLFVSDWPFWLWYYYPIVIAFAFGTLLIEDFVLNKFPVLQSYYPPVIVSLLVLALVAMTAKSLVSAPPKFVPNPLLDAAIQIKQFSDDNPGVYAMGDRAGIVGFLLDSPVVQLEGIVGDNNLLNSIASQNDLIVFFENNSINYYIATNPTKTGTCWNLEEPKIPGPSAPRMRGLLCNEPIFTYTARLDDVTTMIFKVKK